jgi:uncharacterized Zn-finger protein
LTNSDFKLPTITVEQEKVFINIKDSYNLVEISQEMKMNEDKKETKKQFKKGCKKSPILDCLICNKSFKTISGYRSHVSNTHERVGASGCHVCKKVFVNKYALERHIKCVHRKEKPFVCDRCPSTFATSTHLSGHVKRGYTKLYRKIPWDVYRGMELP